MSVVCAIFRLSGNDSSVRSICVCVRAQSLSLSLFLSLSLSLSLSLLALATLPVTVRSVRACVCVDVEVFDDFTGSLPDYANDDRARRGGIRRREYLVTHLSVLGLRACSL